MLTCTNHIPWCDDYYDVQMLAKAGPAKKVQVYSVTNEEIITENMLTNSDTGVLLSPNCPRTPGISLWSDPFLTHQIHAIAAWCDQRGILAEESITL